MKKTCTDKCLECVICDGKPLCCICSHSGYHACVTSPRRKKLDPTRRLPTGQPDLDLNGIEKVPEVKDK